MPISEQVFADRAAAMEKKAEKPGFLTSEFWASCVGQPLVALGAALKLVDAGSPIAAAIVGIIGLAGPIVFTFWRSGLKKALALGATTITTELAKKES